MSTAADRERLRSTGLIGTGLIGTVRQIERVELGTRLIPYREGWALQRSWHDQVAESTQPNALLMMEHESIFTAGSGTKPQDRPVDGSEVIEVDRGGRITWHGPGQLVGYPIVRLPQRLDVVAYVRSLEDLIIAGCAEFGVTGQRVAGRSGVWVNTDNNDESAETGESDEQWRKVAAIGVRVSRGVTMHGFSLNCDCSLSWATQIVPCGIVDAGVTSLTAASGAPVSVTNAARVLTDLLRVDS